MCLILLQSAGGEGEWWVFLSRRWRSGSLPHLLLLEASGLGNLTLSRKWRSGVEILSSILRSRSMPASGKRVWKLEGNRRWPGVGSMMCRESSPHGHPSHIHPMIAMVTHWTLMADGSTIMGVDQGLTLAELLVPAPVILGWGPKAAEAWGVVGFLSQDDWLLGHVEVVLA